MSHVAFTVPLSKIIDELALEVIYTPNDPKERLVVSPDLNRPGLALSGFLDYFDCDRIQMLGKSEYGFLEDLDEATRSSRVDEWLRQKPPAVIITRSQDVLPEIEDGCRRYEIPLLRSADTTSSSMAALIAFLNIQLAPRITRHGVLVEVYGEGILLIGDSGVGKSETAIELIKRGHRLIADDAVEIRRVSAKTLVGTAPDNIRHFIELRGVGIINARRLFGMGSVKMTEKIDMVIELEPWDNNKIYDRMGLEDEYAEILGIQVTKMTIPVKPGRNLAIIIEVAAMNNRHRKMGYNAAQELMHNLGMDVEPPVADKEWDKF